MNQAHKLISTNLLLLIITSSSLMEKFKKLFLIKQQIRRLFQFLNKTFKFTNYQKLIRLLTQDLIAKFKTFCYLKEYFMQFQVIKQLKLTLIILMFQFISTTLILLCWLIKIVQELFQNILPMMINHNI
ncbi:transmembrane protein, putative (macronuclear) [Tetrahymena thermophila SB210]|uniref:Transmembrane protein, putative n=1 Tax=Tetrahymena thermophila (strain SB210) TaxID=312017 RepID=W7XGF4_TETTS|nr:transmembrane protein, putative [Tetrahymena thermophila SB210]EWS76053.1 transmembrane protein, putative [Tetrahymena thermophila SB210]|eukprot:XP_012651404.1 transmembrane protein, putative [Tetrahymena thermophila SB210]